MQLMKISLPVLLTIMTLSACQNQVPEAETNEVETFETAASPLADLLNDKKTDFLAKADSAKIADYDAGLKAVEESGILASALNVNDQAIDFSLKNQEGETVNLKELLENGPVVLTWYRGGWRPYCNITLAFLQEKLPEFELAGARLVAITPELPDSSLSTAEKHELQFDILSDVGNKVAKQYGLVFKLTDAVAKRYRSGFDLHAYNGDDSNELPLAATYIIDSEGKIRYAFLDADYRNRAEPDELLRILGELN